MYLDFIILDSGVMARLHACFVFDCWRAQQHAVQPFFRIKS